MLTRKFSSTILYFLGLVGAMTIAFGITQAIFTDKLINVVSLSGNLCDLGDDNLKRWEKTISSNTGQFVYLKVEIEEDPGACKTGSIGEYPFMTKTKNSSLLYTMPLIRSVTANSMPRLEIPVSEAAGALLADGFLDFYNDGSLVGSGVFFVDLQDSQHTGPLYRFVPAPYSLETSQMYKCTTSFYNTSGFLARSWTFAKNCIISF